MVGGGGGRLKYKKNIRARETVKGKKIHERQLTLWPKKNSFKEFDNEKKIPTARKFPSPPTPQPPPITFLLVRPSPRIIGGSLA